MYKHFVPIWFLLVFTTNSYAHLGVSGEHADTERDYPSGESHRHKPTGLSANPYTSTLDENTRPGRFVSDLTLTDRDTEEFAVGLAVRGSVSSGLFRWKKGGKYQTGTSTSSIYTNGMLDYETNQSHTVIVTVWDESDKQASLYNDGQNPGAGWHQTTAVTLHVRDVDENRNFPPVIHNTMGGSRIFENVAAGTQVCCNGIRAIDDNLDAVLTYSLSGVDASSFRLSNDWLYASTSFDYESKDSYLVTVTAMDQHRASDSYSFGISIVDVVDESCSPPAFIPGVLDTHPPVGVYDNSATCNQVDDDPTEDHDPPENNTPPRDSGGSSGGSSDGGNEERDDEDGEDEGDDGEDEVDEEEVDYTPVGPRNPPTAIVVAETETEAGSTVTAANVRTANAFHGTGGHYCHPLKEGTTIVELRSIFNDHDLCVWPYHWDWINYNGFGECHKGSFVDMPVGAPSAPTAVSSNGWDSSGSGSCPHSCLDRVTLTSTTSSMACAVPYKVSGGSWIMTMTP